MRAYHNLAQNKTTVKTRQRVGSTLFDLYDGSTRGVTPCVTGGRWAAWKGGWASGPQTIAQVAGCIGEGVKWLAGLVHRGGSTA